MNHQIKTPQELAQLQREAEQARIARREAFKAWTLSRSTEDFDAFYATAEVDDKAHNTYMAALVTNTNLRLDELYDYAQVVGQSPWDEDAAALIADEKADAQAQYEASQL